MSKNVKFETRCVCGCVTEIQIRDSLLDLVRIANFINGKCEYHVSGIATFMRDQSRVQVGLSFTSSIRALVHREA